MSRIPAVPATHAGRLGGLIYRYAVRRYGAVPDPLAASRWRCLLDAGGERFDLVDALAFPLPVTVIAELLGLPPPTATCSVPGQRGCSPCGSTTPPTPSSGAASPE